MTGTEPLFLRQIAVSNFRSFGEAKSIMVRPVPGVTVIAGANGLGKTSLLEAIEWALTGTVRRLAASAATAGVTGKDVEKALTREGAPTGSHHRVQLLFDNEVSVTREWDLEITGGETPIRSVEELLTSSDWHRQIDDLSAYLATTHFLSQAAGLRLTARSPKDRWKDLSGLTGGLAVDEMVNRLGVGATKAFNREVEKAEGDVAAAARRLEYFRRILREIAQADALLGAQSALSPAEALEQAHAIAAEFGALTGQRPDLPAMAVEALAVVAEAVRQARAQAELRDRAIQAAARALQSWIAQGDAIRRMDEDIQAGEAATEAAAAEANGKAALEVQARSVLEAAQGGCASVSQYRDRLDSRLSAFRQIQEVDKERGPCSEAINEAVAEHGRIESEKQRLERDLERVRGIDDEVAAHNKDLTADRALKLRASKVLEAEERAREIQPELAVARDRRRLLEARHNGLTRELDDLDAGLKDAEARLEELRTTATKRAGLVTELLGQLHAHETDCPFCQTPFKTHDELAGLAQQAAEKQDPALGETAAQLKEMRHRRDGLKATRTELDRTITVAKAVETEHTGVVENAAEMVSAFPHLPGAGGRPAREALDWLSHRIAHLEGECERLKVERRLLDPDGKLSARLPGILSRLDEAGKTLERERGRGNALDQRRGEAIGVLVADTELAAFDEAATNDALEKALRDLADAATGETLAQAMLNSAIRDRQTADAQRRRCAEHVDLLRRDREELERQRLAARTGWEEAGLPGEPSELALSAAQRETGRRTERLPHLSDRCDATAKGLERWQSNESVQNLKIERERTIREEKAANAEDCEKRLEQHVFKCQRRVDTCRRARRLAGTAADTIKSEHKGFLEEVINPLNNLTDAFSRAWSFFPEFSTELATGISNSQTHVKAQALGHPANLIHSEGQAGVFSLSFLLAASTAYPWSRWRALLLDDPLQYNDILHKAAFLDLLRPLVAERNYQVFLSTHDLEEARFIGRKCKNARLPFTLIQLRAIGDNGVEYDIE
ncbi:AAA family ATPase (plasmid) [Azospirillum melinis]|uniref:AAA family ATPase n=1 Tax=Azospirillum melinis TaxID=328839 RepID=UPI0037565ADF